jgi:hypothetical protein
MHRVITWFGGTLKITCKLELTKIEPTFAGVLNPKRYEFAK